MWPLCSLVTLGYATGTYFNVGAVWDFCLWPRSGKRPQTHLCVHSLATAQAEDCSLKTILIFWIQLRAWKLPANWSSLLPKAVSCNKIYGFQATHDPYTLPANFPNIPAEMSMEKENLCTRPSRDTATNRDTATRIPEETPTSFCVSDRLSRESTKSQLGGTHKCSKMKWAWRGIAHRQGTRKRLVNWTWQKWNQQHLVSRA